MLSKKRALLRYSGRMLEILIDSTHGEGLRISSVEKKETPGSRWEKARVEYRSDQLWWFSHEMQVGDIVFAYSRKTILGVGRIVGGYEFVEGDVEHFDLHCRPVKWIEIESKSVVDNLPGDLQKKLRRDETIILLSKREGQQVMALYKPT